VGGRLAVVKLFSRSGHIAIKTTETKKAAKGNTVQGLQQFRAQTEQFVLLPGSFFFIFFTR
jgi:hypothetical protein